MNKNEDLVNLQLEKKYVKNIINLIEAVKEYIEDEDDELFFLPSSFSRYGYPLFSRKEIIKIANETIVEINCQMDNPASWPFELAKKNKLIELYQKRENKDLSYVNFLEGLVQLHSLDF